MNIPDHYPKRPSVLQQVNYNSMNLHSTVNVHIDNEEPKNDFAETFDYVMVFPLKDLTTQTKECKHCLNAMLEAGLEIYPYKSVQDDELIVLVRAPEKRLAEFADGINYKLLIHPEVLQRIVEEGDHDRRVKGVKINDNREICMYSPFEHIYLEYRRVLNQGLYGRLPANSSPFSNRLIRLKLTYNLLRAAKTKGGCGLEISKLLLKQKILAMYPLHEEKMLREIETACMDKSIFPWQVPIHSIKEYFGEKIALYNVFLGHYSLWLVVPSIIGLAFQLVVWGSLDFSSPVLPFYSLVITVWSVFMLEYWKRQEATTAMVWGMSEFESQEQDRPEFKGDTMKSFIDGRDITYNPPSMGRKIMTLTQSVVACFITMVIGVVAGIYFFRFTLQKRNSTSPYASTVASVLNTIQILVFNAIYQVAALKLTDMENHRTDTSYEDSLIIKLFVFQFINSYASFFFIAFIAGNLERPDNVPEDFLGQCGATNCMEPLSINLAIIFGSRLTITNIIDIALPYFLHRQKYRKETSGIDEAKKADVTKAENEYYLMQYKPMIDSIQNYADTAVQYGFTLLFITALPCASFFSLLNSYVKVKFTAWKLCRLYQRPIPSGAQDIGTWQTIFAIISVASVVTNAGLVCFTMDVLWGYSLQGRVWIFIGFQWVLIMCQFIAQAIIPDVPEDVTIQLERNHFYNEKVVEKVEDEDYDETDADDEYEDNQGGGAAGCCGLVGRSKTKRMRNDLSDFPALEYPRNTPENAWPTPISGQDSRLGPAAPAPQKAPLKETTVDIRAPESANPALNNYASSYAAVPTASNNYI